MNSSSMRRSSSFSKFGGWLFSAILLLNFSAPFVVAQTPDPASQAPVAAESNQASTASAESKQEAKSSDSTEEPFLHAPMVRAFARLMHMNLDTAGWLFEIINSAILIFAIGYPLTRVLPKILRKRSETLKADLNAAQKLNAEAGERLKVVEAKLAKLDDEVSAMRLQMEEESKEDEVRVRAAIVDESARIVAAAEQEIVAAASQARRGLQSFAAELAIDQAAKQLVLTPETDKALIAEFVSTAGGSAQGGKN